jgi:hypothetical protein
MAVHEQAEVVVRSFLLEAGDQPLVAISRSAALLAEVEQQQRAAVISAQSQHSWAQIGTALGISKQAAHRKFVTVMADDLKAKHREVRRARREGRADDATAALSGIASTAETLRGARHQG